MPVEMPGVGGVSLTVSPPVPSLPDPQGIDSIVVKDSTGMVLLRDTLDSLDPSIWQITAGSFEIEDGVLIARNQAGANTMELRDPAWRDYTLEVRFRNGGAEQLGIRRTDSSGLFYHVFLYDPTTWAPSYVVSYLADGTPTGGALGAPLNFSERGSVTSMMAMVAGSYPLLLLALADGALVAAALALMEQRLCRAFPGLAQQVQSHTLRPSRHGLLRCWPWR
jgi:hypothetical protein